MARRRNSDLDRLLDRLLAGEEPEATGDLAPLLHPARVARAALARSLPAEAGRAHLAALRTDRARNIVVAPADRTPLLRRFAVAALVALVVLVLGASSAVAVSEGAIPGDATYGLKRAAERVSLAMHRHPVGRAALHLRLAGRRLTEIRALRASGRDVSHAEMEYAEAIAEGEQEVLKAQRLGLDSDALLQHVMDEFMKHVARLELVREQVPPQAQAAIDRALDNARRAEERRQERGQGGQGGRGGQPHERPTPPGHGGNPPGKG